MKSFAYTANCSLWATLEVTKLCRISSFRGRLNLLNFNLKINMSVKMPLHESIGVVSSEWWTPVWTLISVDYLLHANASQRSLLPESCLQNTCRNRYRSAWDYVSPAFHCESSAYGFHACRVLRRDWMSLTRGNTRTPLPRDRHPRHTQAARSWFLWPLFSWNSYWSCFRRTTLSRVALEWKIM